MVLSKTMNFENVSVACDKKITDSSQNFKKNLTF